MDTNFISAFPFIIPGVVMLFRATKQLLLRRRIKANGIEVNGTITDLVGGTEETYYPVVQFATREGRWITEQYYADSSTAYIDQSIAIVYNANNPREFIVKTDIFEWSARMPYLILIPGCSLFIIGIIMLIDYLY